MIGYSSVETRINNLRQKMLFERVLRQDGIVLRYALVFFKAQTYGKSKGGQRENEFSRHCEVFSKKKFRTDFFRTASAARIIIPPAGKGYAKGYFFTPAVFLSVWTLACYLIRLSQRITTRFFQRIKLSVLFPSCAMY